MINIKDNKVFSITHCMQTSQYREDNTYVCENIKKMES